MKATAGHMKDALLHLFMLLLFSRLEKTTPIITHVDYPGAFAITLKSFVKKNNLALESKCVTLITFLVETLSLDLL